MTTKRRIIDYLKSTGQFHKKTAFIPDEMVEEAKSIASLWEKGVGISPINEDDLFLEGRVRLLSLTRSFDTRSMYL